MCNVPSLLAACKAALKLPSICEEIGYAGEYDCVHGGHAMLQVRNGGYVKAHSQGGFPARDKIIRQLESAIAEIESPNVVQRKPDARSS